MSKRDNSNTHTKEIVITITTELVSAPRSPPPFPPIIGYVDFALWQGRGTSDLSTKQKGAIN